LRRSVAAGRSARKAALVLAIALLCLGGCSSPRWQRHFRGDVWGGALEAQVTRPDRYWPEGFLLATIPPSIVYEDDISEYYAQPEHEPSDAAQTSADALQIILPAIPTLIGGMKWAGGDEAENFEVVAESLGGIVLIQQVIARTVQRERPDHQEPTSFPSGHTSWVFASTTLIVRDIHDPSDDSVHAIDALLYVPAIYNAWERLAINHHWASDVTVGAFMGVFWTNLVWDMHYKGDQEERATVFEKDGPHGIAWIPTIDVIEGNLAFGVRLGF
jgi:hypothetical protein